MKSRLLTLLFLLALPHSALAQERVWMLDAAEEDVFLVFGVPETDDVGVSLWCKIGSRQPTLFLPTPWATLAENEPVTIMAELGGKTFTLSGKANLSTEVDGSVEAPIPDADNFFAALKTTDRLKLMLGSHKSVFPLDGIRGDEMLALCRQTPEEQPAAP